MQPCRRALSRHQRGGATGRVQIVQRAGFKAARGAAWHVDHTEACNRHLKSCRCREVRSH
eukprot:866082-Prymnesium_polylepis.1